MDIIDAEKALQDNKYLAVTIVRFEPKLCISKLLVNEEDIILECIIDNANQMH